MSLVLKTANLQNQIQELYVKKFYDDMLNKLESVCSNVNLVLLNFERSVPKVIDWVSEYSMYSKSLSFSVVISPLFGISETQFYIYSPSGKRRLKCDKIESLQDDDIRRLLRR